MRWYVPQEQMSIVSLYSAAGELIDIPFKGVAPAGPHTLYLERMVPAGIYILVIQSGPVTETYRIIIIQ